MISVLCGTVITNHTCVISKDDRMNSYFCKQYIRCVRCVLFTSTDTAIFFVKKEACNWRWSGCEERTEEGVFWFYYVFIILYYGRWRLVFEKQVKSAASSLNIVIICNSTFIIKVYKRTCGFDFDTVWGQKFTI